MLRRFGTALLAVVASATMVYAQSPLLTRHTRDVVINGETPLVGHLSSTQTLPITLVLQHRNQAGLDELLKQQYDPSSPLYHRWLTVDQFTQRFGPSVNDYESVKAFARENGLTVVGESRNRMIVQVKGTVANIEKALNINLNLYHDPVENRTFFAPDREPKVNLGFQLWAVNGLDSYSVPKRMLTKRETTEAIANATTGSGPSASFLGSDMRAAYYVNGNSAATLTGTGQYLGLFELLGTDLADLTTYFTNVGQTNNVPVTLLSVDTMSTSCIDNSAGGFCDDTEQTIDMTQAIGMAPGLSGLTMFIGTGGLGGTIDDIGILNAMATTEPLNSVLSCSWAWKPTDNTTDDPVFQEFNTQGQNFFAAAGDSGKWTSSGFAWPADDPYIVSVGGTDLDTASAGGPWASETGWADTGGGISPNKFAIPSWQVAAAATCSKCSQTDRNGPDVAANANYSFYVCADQTKCSANEYGGTSFAAPMWAAYIALANEQSVNQGGTTLGFLDPLIYPIGASSSYDTDFHDITSGGNSNGSTVGYDLSTGWGSPNGNNLINALVPPQVGSFTLSAKPTTVTIAPGGKGASVITATPSNGFNSSIALSSSGAPSGVQVKFLPSSIAGGSGTARVAFLSTKTAKAGTYTITVTGVGGGVTQTTTVSLTIK